MPQVELQNFDDLLAAARAQAAPQRLLFVFARRHLGNQASPLQRDSYARGEGGHLRPVLCADKAPHKLADFAALRAEVARAEAEWDVVFVSSIAGQPGKPPTREQATSPLEHMVEAIEAGVLADLVAFDRDGAPVQFAGGQAPVM